MDRARSPIANIICIFDDSVTGFDYGAVTNGSFSRYALHCTLTESESRGAPSRTQTIQQRFSGANVLSIIDVEERGEAFSGTAGDETREVVGDISREYDSYTKDQPCRHEGKWPAGHSTTKHLKRRVSY